jgi:hypothetical protein
VSGSGLAMLAVTWGAVTAIAGYLFWKVLRTPRK